MGRAGRWTVAGLVALAAFGAATWVSGAFLLTRLLPSGDVRWPVAFGIGAAAAAFAGLWGQWWATEPLPPPPDGPIRRRLPPLPPLVPGTSFVGNVPALPSRFVARADIFDTVRDQIVSHATVGLVGMGGAGKTILATAVARDPAVQATFRDGIAWVDVGQQSTPTQLQERLVYRLTGKMPSFPTTEVGRHRLAELLVGRAFLLVVDDVWDAEALNALNVVGAPRGALLFTTRNSAVARAAGANEHSVDKLTLDQALDLIGRWTDTLDQLPPVADAICLKVGQLALGVALADGMIRSRGAQPQAWDQVMHLLQSADVDAIQDEYKPDNYDHASVLASIDVSIDDLGSPDDDRYRELAVFAAGARYRPGPSRHCGHPKG